MSQDRHNQTTLDIPQTVHRPDTRTEEKKLASLRRVPASFKTKSPTSQELAKAGVTLKPTFSKEDIDRMAEQAAQSRERALRMAEEYLRKGDR